MRLPYLVCLQSATASKDQLQHGYDKSDSEDGDEYDDAHPNVISILSLCCYLLSCAGRIVKA